MDKQLTNNLFYIPVVGPKVVVSAFVGRTVLLGLAVNGVNEHLSLVNSISSIAMSPFPSPRTA